MRFRVSHLSRYEYAEPVFLETHTLRLAPRGGGGQRLLAFSLSVDPRPAGVSEFTDEEGNTAHQVWWLEKTRHLLVQTSFEVETLRSDPFDFLADDPAHATLPMSYSEETLSLLAPYRKCREPNGAARAFATAVAQQTDWRTIPFLTGLTNALYGHVEHVIREEGDALTAEATLAGRRGACRDTAIVFIEGCRALGLAARFVSGYELMSAGEERTDMHAWAEVYLPGGGWRGYDPSRGLAAAETHIAVAAGLTPRRAAPVSGAYRGSAPLASVKFDIDVEQA